MKESPASFDFRALRSFDGVDVEVHLADGTGHTGRLRTELLSERSLSVYLTGAGDEGATLYIDQIVKIVPRNTHRMT
ncbi:MAG: hypothetical protein NVSMB64_23530 [Candidatus Velthaea sp.]